MPLFGNVKRAYDREWLRKGRAEYFTGKACVRCFSTERLELHHLDRSNKVSHRVWSWSKQRRDLELAKCVPLCEECHKKETAVQCARPVTHGTVNAYERYKCRCALCVSTYKVKRWRKQHQLKKLQSSLTAKPFTVNELDVRSNRTIAASL